MHWSLQTIQFTWVHVDGSSILKLTHSPSPKAYPSSVFLSLALRDHSGHLVAAGGGRPPEVEGEQWVACHVENYCFDKAGSRSTAAPGQR